VARSYSARRLGQWGFRSVGFSQGFRHRRPGRL
jgi:hypothetical protein